MSTTLSVAAIFLTTVLLVSCGTAPTTTTAKGELTQKAMTEREEWNKLDPGLEALAKKSEGYAFFPEIIKGGLGVGGAYGRGVVYAQNQPTGYADVTQGSVGLQAGGQTYSELIVFENKAAMDRFKKNQIDFGANASAIIAKTGAAANARFVDGEGHRPRARRTA
jgi:lipid-binding SYLF domain-containing protein